MAKSWSILLTWSLGGVCLVGCGTSRPETLPVTGRILVNNRPLHTGRVTFYPVNGERSATAAIEPNGEFRLTTFENYDGALPGEHRVSIVAMEVVDSTTRQPLTGEDAPSNPNAVVVQYVLEEYSRRETTPLVVTVGDKHHFDFELPPL